MTGPRADFEEVFEYGFTRLDPVRGDHIDPPSVAIYETLLTKGPDGLPAPGLAQNWQISADGMSWRLRLREGARFHSGDPCDSRAVVEALELCRWGEGLPRQVWYWDPVDSVRSLDDLTVEVRLLFPCARLPVLLWGTHTAIANPRTWREWGDDFGVTAADGTGLYRLVSFSPTAVTAELVGTPQIGQPHTLRWSSVVDDEERAHCLSSRQFDAVREVPATSVSSDDARWRIDSQPQASQFYLALSFPAGFDHLPLRRAVYGLIDRDALVASALNGAGHPATSPLPVIDEFAGDYTPTVDQSLARAQATQELATMGFRPGADGILERDGFVLDLECATQDTAVFRRLANELTQQLAPFGIRLRFNYHQPFEDFYRSVADGPDSFLSKWLWQDGMEAAMGFSSSDCIEPAGGNWQRSMIPAVDDAFDSFLRAREGELRGAAENAQRLFMENLPYLPLCSPTETLAVDRAATNFGLSPRTLYPLYGDLRMTGDTRRSERSAHQEDA